VGNRAFSFLLVSFLAREKSTRIENYEPPWKYLVKYRKFLGMEKVAGHFDKLNTTGLTFDKYNIVSLYVNQRRGRHR
jgi:hypothetical protein